MKCSCERCARKNRNDDVALYVAILSLALALATWAMSMWSAGG